MADQLLRDDTRTEMCRTCEGRGTKTGSTESVAQYDEDGKPLLDGAGRHLHIEFPEVTCENGHSWFQGEGKARGTGGEDPILFEEHLAQRRRREIYTQNGTPDPEIVSGIYNRTHPQGRKVNSDEQRKKNGASFFR